MSGTPEQRAALAMQFFGARLGISSEALVYTLMQGADQLMPSPSWRGHDGRPLDWGDLERNLKTFEVLPPWAKDQAREIIIESLRMVNDRYPHDDKFVNAVGRLAWK